MKQSVRSFTSSRGHYSVQPGGRTRRTASQKVRGAGVKKGDSLVLVLTYFLFRCPSISQLLQSLMKGRAAALTVSFSCLLGLGKSWACVEFSMTELCTMSECSPQSQSVPVCLPVLSSPLLLQCQRDVTPQLHGILFVFNTLVLRTDQRISSELAFCL